MPGSCATSSGGTAVASSQASCRGVTSPALPQPAAELTQHVGLPALAGDGQHRGNDLERESRRGLERVQVEQQRAGGVAGLFARCAR